MEKYLYLTEIEWAERWVNGGTIPIKLASSYLSKKRSGINTPDETLIYDSLHDIKKVDGIKVDEGANFIGLTINDVTFNGKKFPNMINISHYREDGLVLSFCNNYSEDIARRLCKKACIKVLDIHSLKNLIDRQLGQEGQMKECCYTPDHQRSPFLKSVADEWQAEYRLYWPNQKARSVDIPKGTAELVNVFL